MTTTDTTPAPSPRVDTGARHRADPTTSIGVGAAGRAVAEDISALVNAHMELTKAEVARTAKDAATRAGAFGAAGVLGWLALQGLLVTAGFALALVVPAWAAALIVSAVLLLGAAVAALVGKRKKTRVSLEATKATVKQDVDTIKTHLGKQP